MADRILVIAPHPDDESIGCGGAICLHGRRGDHVGLVFLTSGEMGLSHLAAEAARATREAEAKAAAEVLGVEHLEFLRLPDMGLLAHLNRGARSLREIIARDAPDVIYLPHPEEVHPDHAAAWPMIRGALGRGEGRGGPPRLRAYEVWTPLPWYDRLEDITPVVGQKLGAIRCHRSQIVAIRHDHAARALGRYRGAMAGCRYAEVFRDLPHTALADAARGLVRYWRNPARLRRLRRLLACRRRWAAFRGERV